MGGAATGGSASTGTRGDIVLRPVDVVNRQFWTIPPHPPPPSPPALRSLDSQAMASTSKEYLDQENIDKPSLYHRQRNPSSVAYWFPPPLLDGLGLLRQRPGGDKPRYIWTAWKLVVLAPTSDSSLSSCRDGAMALREGMHQRATDDCIDGFCCGRALLYKA